jgi:putative transposase
MGAPLRVSGEERASLDISTRQHFVSTVGRDETVIRAHIREQEEADQRLEQMNLWRK